MIIFTESVRLKSNDSMEMDDKFDVGFLNCHNSGVFCLDFIHVFWGFHKII